MQIADAIMISTTSQNSDRADAHNEALAMWNHKYNYRTVPTTGYELRYTANELLARL